MTSWVSAHTALVAALVGLVFNLFTDFARTHKSDSKFWLVADQLLSKAFPDPGGFVRFVMSLFSAPPPPKGPSRVDPMLPPSLHERPTKPTLECGTVWPRFWQLAGVTIAGVVLVGCLALRDAVTFTADEAKCVVARTDQGAALGTALGLCGIENSPEALKFFADLVAEHKAAQAAKACK